MNKVWRVRTEQNKWMYISSAPKARKYIMENPESRMEVLEYQYKYQLVTLLNDAYGEGYDDGKGKQATPD